MPRAFQHLPSAIVILVSVLVLVRAEPPAGSGPVIHCPNRTSPGETLSGSASDPGGGEGMEIVITVDGEEVEFEAEESGGVITFQLEVLPEWLGKTIVITASTTDGGTATKNVKVR